MTKQEKSTWTCQLCRSKMPKSDNSNTPIRYQQQQLLQTRPASQQSPEPNNDKTTNVTIRKNLSTKTKLIRKSPSDEECSIIGDTLYTYSTQVSHENESVTPQTHTLIKENTCLLVILKKYTFRKKTGGK